MTIIKMKLSLLLESKTELQRERRRKQKEPDDSNKFPQKLFDMLQTEDASIVSWTMPGDAFIVQNNDRFVSEILPQYFKQTKIRSFQRQLNLHGFCRITNGPNVWAYHHVLFQRDKSELCTQIKRLDNNNSANKQTPSTRAGVVSNNVYQSESKYSLPPPDSERIIPHQLETPVGTVVLKSNTTNSSSGLSVLLKAVDQVTTTLQFPHQHDSGGIKEEHDMSCSNKYAKECTSDTVGNSIGEEEGAVVDLFALSKVNAKLYEEESGICGNSSRQDTDTNINTNANTLIEMRMASDTMAAGADQDPDAIHNPCDGGANHRGLGNGNPIKEAVDRVPSHSIGPPTSMGMGGKHGDEQKGHSKHIAIDDDNAEYATNADRNTYLLSTPLDSNSLSDRQCYIRSHFVELFVANEGDVQARHSRGAQNLTKGHVGMRCAYCVRLKPRDRAGRAVCYPSSISRIYEAVADMQRFHFENCVAIPVKVRGAYKSLKSTRPRGVDSPQEYWERSAHDIGLIDTELGIQAVSCDSNENVDERAAMSDAEVGRLVKQKKSLATSGMLEQLDKACPNEVLVLGSKDQNDDMTSGAITDDFASNVVVSAVNATISDKKRKRGQPTVSNNETKWACVSQVSSRASGMAKKQKGKGSSQITPTNPYKKQYSGKGGHRRLLSKCLES